MNQEVMMQRMANAIAIGQRGGRRTARTELEALWQGADDFNSVARCGLTHSLADVQDEQLDELFWDLQALTCALGATESDVLALGMADGVAGLMPSLHLNFADGYRRLGQAEVARGHALQAHSFLDMLDANPYLDTIATALERVVDKLDQGNHS